MTPKQNVLTLEASLNMPLGGIQLIEASAGTGKTYTIANLFLRHIVSGRQVHEILVLTFTNAAATELQERLYQRLQDCLTHLQTARHASSDLFIEALCQSLDDPAQAILRLKLALENIKEAAILTIHSFCQKALQDFAFSSGQRFDHSLSTDPLMRDRAIHDWWRQNIYPNTIQNPCWKNSVKNIQGFANIIEKLISPKPYQLDPPPCSKAEMEASLNQIDEQFSLLADIWQSDRQDIYTLIAENKAISKSQISGYKDDLLAETFTQIDQYFEKRFSISQDYQALPKLSLSTLQANKKSRSNTEDLPQHRFFEHCQSWFTLWQNTQKKRLHQILQEASEDIRSKLATFQAKTGEIGFDDLILNLHDALYGEQGFNLAQQLRAWFPVAMIDEFQDTDHSQYAIFRAIYLPQKPSQASLMMIGDPKQAIYSFRGGDIFTYLTARKDADIFWTLNTNWRSTPELVESIDHLFSRNQAFIVDQIDLAPITAQKIKPHRYLKRFNQKQTAQTIWQLPESCTNDQLEHLVNLKLCEEIGNLLQESEAGHCFLGDRALAADDIAILVRDHKEGAAIQSLLRKYGMASVHSGKSHIWQSAEAENLFTLLKAMTAPHHAPSIRLALANPLYGYTIEDLNQIKQQSDLWYGHQKSFEAMHEQWQLQGFMAAFQSLLKHIETGLIRFTPFPERRLTNLIHLGELIQKASQTHPNMEALLNWYQTQLNQTHSEEEIRLESDADLIQITTIHQSKGLQYPVVFVPFLWRARALDTNNWVSWTDETERFPRPSLSHINSKHPPYVLAERERLAEDLRLLYVALTRAESCLYWAWGFPKRKTDKSKTAMAWLLDQSNTSNDIKKHEFIPQPAACSKQIEQLAQLDSFHTQTLSTETPDMSCLNPGTDKNQDLVLPRSFHLPFQNWRIASFSALTKNLAHTTVVQEPPVGGNIGLNYPSGPVVGNFLHTVLEELDFQQSIEPQLELLQARLQNRFALDQLPESQALADWLSRVLHTSFHDAHITAPSVLKGLSLHSIEADKQLRELPFDLATNPVNLYHLNQVLVANQLDASNTLQTTLPTRPELAFETFTGMINGIIDLVFEYKGRFYLADYKSNLLGRSLNDYQPHLLLHAIHDRYYDLQYLLYSLALHRFLKQRLADYQYEQHFGGAFYLFIRGMQAKASSHTGVYYHRVSKALMDRLDQAVFDFHPGHNNA